MSEEQRVFTAEELRQFDGKEGRPAYVAYQGRVYDVSASKMWRKGMHMRKHDAGVDLTTEFGAAPHGEEVFERVAQVGVLAAPAEPVSAFPHLPAFLAAWLERVPFLERHPHPMTVHFPIVFMFAAPIFALLYLITGNRAFETTSAHTLGGGVLFTLVGIATGLLTWWVNYMARPMPPVLIKIVVSIVMFLVSLAAFVWRLLDPTILTGAGRGHVVYLLLLLSLVPLVSVLGAIGATLTFPLPKREKKE